VVGPWRISTRPGPLKLAQPAKEVSPKRPTVISAVARPLPALTDVPTSTLRKLMPPMEGAMCTRSAFALHDRRVTETVRCVTEDQVEGLEITPEDPVIVPAGDTASLSVTALFPFGFEHPVAATWASSKPEVARVTPGPASDTTVSALQRGSTTITATFRTARATVTVAVP
jgi:hypothetical protein